MKKFKGKKLHSAHSALLGAFERYDSSNPFFFIDDAIKDIQVGFGSFLVPLLN